MTAPSLPLNQKPSRVTWPDLLTIAVLTAAVFIPVFHTGFSPLDDYVMLVQNDDVVKPSWAAFVRSWTEPSFRIYMPLTLSIWQAIAALTLQGTYGEADFSLPVTGYKIASIATHGLAAAAAAWALSVITRTRWPAIMGALVFALHPFQVESVAWTTGLKDEICGLFSILAIGFFARHVIRDPDQAYADGWWWAAMMAALLAMLCKPTAMVTPLMFFAVDLALRRVPFVKRFLSTAPLLMPAIACGLVAVAVQGTSPVPSVPVYLRPLLAADTYAFYLAKTVWPVQMAVDYGRRPTVVLESGAIWWTWLLPAACFVAVLWTRSPLLLLAAALFVVPVLPVSGLTIFDMQQYSTVTDHYAYQALFGVGLAVTLLLMQKPRWPAAVVGLAVCVLAVQTHRTATGWQDIIGFYRKIERVNTKSWLARDLLGVHALNQGDFVTAERLIRQTLADNPKSGGTLDNLSRLELLRGRYRESFDAGFQATQYLVVSRLDLARRLTLLGTKLNDPAASEKGLRYWLRIEPDNRYVIDMLQSVRAAQARQAATQPLPPATARP